MQVPHSFKRFLLCSLIALSACGGGGGGGSAPSSNAQPAAQATLLLTGFTWGSLPVKIVSASEAALASTQLGAELALRFSTSGAPLTQAVPCKFSVGQLSVTLNDLDKNGIASAGDRLTVQATNCNNAVFNDNVDGTLTFDLQPSTSLADGRFAALVRLEELKFPSKQQTLSGSFVVDLNRTTLTQSWRVTASAADDLKLVPFYSTAAAYLRSPVLSKTVDYATARGQVTLALRYETDAGSALVSTPVPLSAYLNRAPDQGLMEILGSNGKVRITTSRTQFGTDAQTELLLGGATTPADSNAVAWAITMSQGFLWWDGQKRDTSTLLPVYDTQAYTPYIFEEYLGLPDAPRMTSADAVFRAQFSRPPASLPKLFYRFYDTNGLAVLPVIAASAEVHGAVVLIRPAQALSPGRQYAIRTSSDGAWPEPGLPFPDISVSDAEGHEMKLYGGLLGYFNTPSN